MQTYKKVSQMPKKLRDEAEAIAEQAAEKYVNQTFGKEPKEAKPGQVLDRAALEQLSTFKRGELFNAMMARGFTGHPGELQVETTPQENRIPKTDVPPPTPQAALEKERKFPIVKSPHGDWRQGTVTHRVYEFQCLPADKALTVPEMHERLVKEFAGPDHTPDQLMITLRCQLQRQGPNRGFVLGRDAQGRYSMHIKGFDKTRVPTPEQAAKRAAKEKLAAEAKAAKEKAKADAKALKAEAQAKAKAEKERLKAKAKAAQDKAVAEAAAKKAEADKLAAEIAAKNAQSKSAQPTKGNAAKK